MSSVVSDRRERPSRPRDRRAASRRRVIVIGLDPMPRGAASCTSLTICDRARLAGLLSAAQVTHVIHAGLVSGPMCCLTRRACHDINCVPDPQLLRRPSKRV